MGNTPSTGQSSTPDKNTAGQLSDNYYLDNFNYLLEFITRHYSHLLTVCELDFCKNFHSLSHTAQQVFVRLSSRSTALLRTSKLNYPEIDNIEGGIDELASVGLVSKEVEFSAEESAALFSRAELKAALGLTSTQFDLANISDETFRTPDLFGDSPLAQLLSNDSVIEVHHKEHILTFKLLFFGNLYQDFSSFVLRDLGLRQYENYPIEKKTLLFQQREQIDAHLQYYQCYELYDSACERGSDALQHLHSLLPQAIANDKTLARRLDKFKNKIARQLERENSPQTAADIYTLTTRPPARERLARIDTKLGNTEKALALCKAIQESPFDSDELDFAETFGARLSKKTKQSFSAPEPYTPPEMTLHLHSSKLPVEFTVALHYARTGKCYYLENNLINSVFGLALWDIIFAPMSGVFFHPFQHQPADFYEPEFSSTREHMIEQRLQEIANKQLQKFVFSHYNQKHGIRNPMVNWHLTKPHILSMALKRIPAEDWVAIFKLLLGDIRNYRSGQPDLIYFPDEGGYQFLEVKAPGDRIQKNQLRWMKFFRQQNVLHSVVHVEWLE